MTKTVVACSIIAVAFVAPSRALADPITIVSNGTGVAGITFASENGIDDMKSDPDVPNGPNSFHLTSRVGGSLADATASVATDLTDPLRLRARGSTDVSYSTEIGQAEGHIASYFFVFFELDHPRPYVFDGQFETSGDAASGVPLQDRLSTWTISLLAMSPAPGSGSEVLTLQGYDSTRVVRSGLLSGGLYRFAVISDSFGANITSGPGPGSGHVFSNFRFSLDVGSQPPVPEPGSLLLMGTGLCALLTFLRSRVSWAASQRYR